MGLCKCPKKKVTSLFCFEHRVNVCEHCLVTNHPQCVVQSYLQWLQDSDYDPTCRLCSSPLTSDESSNDEPECVRLLCYDVFHWSCLDSYCRKLPPNTAPAGYQCPTCSSPVFPAKNVVSPVAEKLREAFSRVNWARSGLGLPLIDEVFVPKSVSITAEASAIPSTVSSPFTGSEVERPVSTSTPYNQNFAPLNTLHGSHSLNVDEATPYPRLSDKVDYSARRLFEDPKDSDAAHDHDLDKYKRRPALQWLAHWFNSRSSKPLVSGMVSARRRSIVLLIFGIIAFLTLILVFSQLGSRSTESDPFLDPMANPNIRIAESNR